MVAKTGQSAEIMDILVSRIQKNQKLPADIDVNDFDYLESGHIDSIALIAFVADLETEFDIEFSDDEIMSEDFRTIGGLAGMISKKRS